MAFAKGQSGNPKGRPPKDRALTAILEKAGDGKILVGDKQVARKTLLAQMLWEAAVTGGVTFPNSDKPMPIQGDDWLDVVQFLYKHIDGAPKAEVDVTSAGQPVKGYALITPDDWDKDDPSN